MRISYGVSDLLPLARALRPHIVFLDVPAAGATATEVARRLCSEPDLQRVLIVALDAASRPGVIGALLT